MGMSVKDKVLPANNAVQLTSNGVILLVRTGFQSPKSMDELREQTEKLIHRLRDNRKKVFILIDDSRVGGYDKAVRFKIAEFIKAMDYDAIAIYGLNPVIRFLTEAIIVAGRQKRRVQTFDDQHKASLWLARHILQLPAKY